MAMAYPKHIHNNEQDQTTKYYMAEFIINLGHVLPCELCKNSYHNFINKLKFMEQLNSRKDLTRFFYNLHNKVNYKLGVPECNIPSYKKVIEYYSTFIAGKPCKATTEQDKKEKKLLGCKNIDFANYECNVKVLDKNNNNIEKTLDSFKNLTDSNSNYCPILFLLLIIAIIIIVILLLKLARTH